MLKLSIRHHEFSRICQNNNYMIVILEKLLFSTNNIVNKEYRNGRIFSIHDGGKHSQIINYQNYRNYFCYKNVRYFTQQSNNKHNSNYSNKIKSKIMNIFNNKEINTIPNIITISRIISSPLLAMAIANDMKVLAFGGCVVFAFTDWLDGYLATKLNQKTVLGAFLDPVADKFMIGSLTIGLIYQNLIPLPLGVIIIGRDVTLVLVSFILRSRERPEGSTFFDTSDSATFSIAPSNLSKFNTGMQFLLLSSTLSHFAFSIPSLVYIEPLWYITGTTTILSGLGYLDGSGIRKLSEPKVGRGKQ